MLDHQDRQVEEVAQLEELVTQPVGFLRAHSRAGLIEEKDLGIVAHEGPGQGDLLPLPSGEVDPGVEPLAERCVISLGQRGDQLVGSGLLARADDGLALGDLPAVLAEARDADDDELRVEVERGVVDVHVDRGRAGVINGGDGSHEREGRGDDLIARPNARRQQGQVQRAGTGV